MHLTRRSLNHSCNALLLLGLATAIACRASECDAYATDAGGTISGTSLQLHYGFDPLAASLTGADHVLSGGFVGSVANQAPLAQDRQLSTTPEQTIELVSTMTDPDGDAVRSIVLAGPAHGHLSGTGSLLRYHPDPDFIGDDRVRLRLDDGHDLSPVIDLAISIRAPAIERRVTIELLPAPDDIDIFSFDPPLTVPASTAQLSIDANHSVRFAFLRRASG